jgi:hypothetical protein
MTSPPVRGPAPIFRLQPFAFFPAADYYIGICKDQPGTMLSASLQSIARCSGTLRARAKLTNNNAQYIGIFQAHASALAVNLRRLEA